jgi:PP-loop superfamily ATP-utilizing enzyme
VIVVICVTVRRPHLYARCYLCTIRVCTTSYIRHLKIKVDGTKKRELKEGRPGVAERQRTQ